MMIRTTISYFLILVLICCLIMLSLMCPSPYPELAASNGTEALEEAPADIVISIELEEPEEPEPVADQIIALIKERGPEDGNTPG